MHMSEWKNNDAERLTNPEAERTYTDSEKKQYIKRLGSGDNLQNASENEIHLYRQFVDDLCRKDDITALRTKGYGCYGGDHVFECDWQASLECVTRLYELTGEPQYANTLGYIYYYGRCWDGQPQYEEAFRYFSIGAAGFYYESRYKLADMFLKGQGVVRNTKIACSLLEELYEQNLAYMLDGQFDCKFADIALRLGSCAESRILADADDRAAYCLYLQADFAIRQRLPFGYYGDASVAENISDKLGGILASGKVKPPVKTASVNLKSLLSRYLKKPRQLCFKLQPLKGDDIKLTLWLAPEDERQMTKLFITEPDTGFCGLLATLHVCVKNAAIQGRDRMNENVYFDDIQLLYDVYTGKHHSTKALAFMLGGEIQAVILGEWCFTSPKNNAGKCRRFADERRFPSSPNQSEEKHRFATVIFTPGGKRYDYLLEIDGIAIGDKVVVETGRGKTTVEVVELSEKAENELSLPFSRYKKILEKAE